MLAACSAKPAELAPYLASVDAKELAKLDRATWDRVVVPEFRALYDDYAAGFEIAPWRGAIATRKHFAGDPELTLGQQRARWLVPVLFPSEVATAGGHPIDAVFVRDGDRWLAFAGIDRVIRARVDRLDPACGAAIDVAVASKTCRETAFLVAQTALLPEPTRFHRACAIAARACAKPSP